MLDPGASGPNASWIPVDQGSRQDPGYDLFQISFTLKVIRIITRISSSLGWRMKFKTLFMSVFDLTLFFNMSKQLLAPGGLNAECFQISVM